MECKPWERQEGESARAFQAFTEYRDMGEKRSLRAVARKVQKSEGLIQRWSRNWGWKARVRDYDKMLEEERLKRLKKQHIEDLERNRKVAGQVLGVVLTGLKSIESETLSAADISRLGKLYLDLLGSSEVPAGASDEAEKIVIVGEDQLE